MAECAIAFPPYKLQTAGPILWKPVGWVGATAETQQFSANAGFINPAYHLLLQTKAVTGWSLAEETQHKVIIC